MAKVLIAMSPEDYDLFVAECDINSREYSILKNGIVITYQSHAHEPRALDILCAKDEALLLLDAAKRLYPRATPAIAKGIELASDF